MGWGRMLKNDSILVDRNYTVHINSENENELTNISSFFVSSDLSVTWAMGRYDSD